MILRFWLESYHSFYADKGIRDANTAKQGLSKFPNPHPYGFNKLLLKSEKSIVCEDPCVMHGFFN